jgi:hypothetical protein
MFGCTVDPSNVTSPGTKSGVHILRDDTQYIDGEQLLVPQEQPLLFFVPPSTDSHTASADVINKVHAKKSIRRKLFE